MGDMRLAGSDGSCGRWYFMFNGAECTNPYKIEGVVYTGGYGTSVNLHRPRVVNGVYNCSHICCQENITSEMITNFQCARQSLES